LQKKQVQNRLGQIRRDKIANTQQKYGGEAQDMQWI